MKPSFLFIFLIGLTITSQANDGYTVKGTINGNYSGKIFLSNALTRDSVLVENNSFEFSGKVDKPILSWLHLKGTGNAVWIYLENSPITVTGDFKITAENNRVINIYDNARITGSYSQKLLDEYHAFYDAHKKDENFNALRFTELKKILSANSSQPVSGYILGRLVESSTSYSYDEYLKLLSLLDSEAMHPADIATIKGFLRTLNLYGVGQPFVLFNLPSQSGEIIDISKYNGKVTLLDFWASWCAPCRAKHPELIAMKKKYTDSEKFTIVSISIDKDKNAWQKAIVQDGLSWDNLLDTNGHLKNELNLPLIPFNYLLDGDGNILAINQSLEKIDLLLQEKLK